MTTERKLDICSLWHMEYPFFEGAESSKVNEYFEKLTKTAREYCQSESFPQFTKYYLTYNTIEENEKLTVNVSLGLRQRGRFIRRKQIEIILNSGLIEKQTITELL